MIYLPLMGLFFCAASVAPVQATDLDDRLNFFDIELLQALTVEGDDNIIVSPTSVKAALTTLVEGTGGRTAQEILTLLRLPSDTASIRTAAKRSLAPFKVQRDGTELSLATRLWAGSNVAVNQKYRDIIRDNYGSDIQPLNFGDPAASANAINDWVYQQTRGHIPSIVAPGGLDAGTKLLLTNALYLKGNWKTSFNPDMTSVRCFRVPNRGCQNSYLMHSQDNYPLAYIPSLDATVVEIPYSDPRLSMLIFLPERPEDGINRLSRDLTHTPLSFILKSMEETEVMVTLPRFTIESKLELRPVLEKLGVRDLFDLNANVSGIIDGPVQVGNVLHNAKIEVNEKGTIAAAVSAISVIPLMGSTVQRFRADRPFIFILRESETGSALFAGRVMKPDPAPEQGANTSSNRRLRRSGVQ